MAGKYISMTLVKAYAPPCILIRKKGVKVIIIFFWKQGVKVIIQFSCSGVWMVCMAGLRKLYNLPVRFYVLFSSLVFIFCCGKQPGRASKGICNALEKAEIVSLNFEHYCFIHLRNMLCHLLINELVNFHSFIVLICYVTSLDDSRQLPYYVFAINPTQHNIIMCLQLKYYGYIMCS